MANNLLPPVPPITADGFQDPVWAKWLGTLHSTVTNVVTNPSSIAVAPANGFAGTVSQIKGGTATITLQATTEGLLKGNGQQLVPAVAGTDYLIENQNIKVTGDVTGNGTTAIALTLAAYIGECVEQTSPSSVTLTSGAVININTLALTPGDWDVSGVATVTGASTSTMLGISTGSDFGNLGSYTQVFGGAGTMLTPPVRINVSATTNVNLLVQSVFTGSATGTGYLRARRVR